MLSDEQEEQEGDALPHCGQADTYLALIQPLYPNFQCRTAGMAFPSIFLSAEGDPKHRCPIAAQLNRQVLTEEQARLDNARFHVLTLERLFHSLPSFPHTFLSEVLNAVSPAEFWNCRPIL